MALTRKSLLAASAGAYVTVGIVRFPASAAEFDFKLATDNPADYHMTVRMVEAAGKIKQDSNGRLDIHVYPNNQLGNSESQIVQVRSRAVEMCAAANLAIAESIPVAGIISTPFVLRNATEGLSVMAGPLGKYIRNEIAKFNTYPLERSWSSGLRQVINRLRPIYTPDDLKGLKIRTPQTPVDVALFKAFGAAPTPITSSEMYLALQTHLVDGIELTVPAIQSYKVYEVQRYVSYTNHIMNAYIILMNRDAWDGLPMNLRDMTEHYFTQASAVNTEDVAHLEDTLEGTLRSEGMVFNRADIASFRAAVRRAGLYQQWQQSYGLEVWALLEKAVGRLTG